MANNDFANNRALHLLLQVPVFDGTSGQRFSDWVRRIDSVLENSQWNDADKKHWLQYRLAGNAYDVYTDVYLPNDTYEQLRDKIKNRYHGQETNVFFQREFDMRVRRSEETIHDYAYSLKKLFVQAYPLVNTADLRLPFLKRAFLKGVSPALRQALVHYEYNTFEDLIAKAVTIDTQQFSEQDDESRNRVIRAVAEAKDQPSASNRAVDEEG